MSADHQRWRVLLMAGIAVVLSLTTWFSATAILTELTQVLGLNGSHVAWLTNAVQLGFVVGALVVSIFSLADRWKLTTLMALASLAAGFFNALLLLEPSPLIAVALRFATGVALAMIYPPAMKFIATWFQKGRGLAMGTMVGALTLGSAMPHLIRGLGQGVDWQLVITISSMCCLAAAAVFGMLLREGPFPFAKTSVDPLQLGAIIKSKPVMLANAGYFGHMWELYAMWGWFLAYIMAAQAEGLSFANVSILTFAVIALGAPGCVLCGWLADRIGRCYATSLMMLISGTSALLIGFTFEGPATAFMLVALIWGLTVVADSAQFSAAVTELADQSLVGSALAFQMGVGFAITIFVIWFLPIVVDVFGSWRWAFIVLAPGPFLGVVAMLVLRRDDSATLLANGRR